MCLPGEIAARNLVGVSRYVWSRIGNVVHIILDDFALLRRQFALIAGLRGSQIIHQLIVIGHALLGQSPVLILHVVDSPVYIRNRRFARDAHASERCLRKCSALCFGRPRGARASAWAIAQDALGILQGAIADLLACGRLDTLGLQRLDGLLSAWS